MSVREFYNSVATRYDAFMDLHQYVGPTWLAEVLLLMPTPRRAIDFGCANGALGKIIRQIAAGARLLGIDISNAMLEQAASRKVYDELYELDLAKPIPLIPTSSADLAVALGFIEFLDHPSNFLNEACRCLCEDGWLLVSFQAHWHDRPADAPRQTTSGGMSFTMPIPSRRFLR